MRAWPSGSLLPDPIKGDSASEGTPVWSGPGSAMGGSVGLGGAESEEEGEEGREASPVKSFSKFNKNKIPRKFHGPSLAVRLKRCR